MADLEFPALGSLYFEDKPLDFSNRERLDFCIGPDCGPRYWDCNAGEPRYYHNTKANLRPCALSVVFSSRTWTGLLTI
jgi:hypothetical protein